MQRRSNTDGVCLATQCCNSLLDFPLGRIEPVEERDNVLRFLSVDPIRVGIVGCRNRNSQIHSLIRQYNNRLPSKVRVRLISPMMSFRNLLASSRDEVRLMLRRKDSKCLGSVRIVIFSVVD